jgi:hypothetical protein
MFGKNTLEKVVEMALEEQPPLTDEQLEHLEDPVTPEARALVGLVDAIDELELEGVDQFGPVLKRQLRVEALWCMETLTQDPRDGAWERRTSTRSFLLDVFESLDPEAETMLELETRTVEETGPPEADDVDES